MARLKVRFRFNPGGAGAPMDRLGEFSVQAERFLRSLAHDFGLEAKKGYWLAKNFRNESVGFDAEFAGAPAAPVSIQASTALKKIFGDDPLGAIGDHVSYGTLAEFSKIGQALNPDEYYMAGVYDDAAPVDDAIQLERITYQKSAEIRQLLSVPQISHGALQGVMHAWHYGSEPPFFSLRSLQNGDLVRCEYPQDMHHEIHAATEERNAVLIVTGDIQWDRATNSIVRICVDTPPSSSKPLTESEFDRLFGSAPDFTGTMTTAEYIDWVRGDGD